MKCTLIITLFAMQVLLCTQVKGGGAGYLDQCASHIAANADAILAQFNVLDESVDATCKMIIAMDPTPEDQDQCVGFLSKLDITAAYGLLATIKLAARNIENGVTKFCEHQNDVHTKHPGW